MAFALCYYMEYLNRQEVELEEVSEMGYEDQNKHFVQFLYWLLEGNHVANNRKESTGKGTCNAYLKDVFGFFLYMADCGLAKPLQILSYNQITVANAVGVKRTIRAKSFKGYFKPKERNVRAAEEVEIIDILQACTNSRDQLLLLMIAETGFRIGEILGVDYTRDIDYQRKTVRVYFNLRSEQVYIRGFLEDLNQSETENVCMVTSQQMDEYFRAEQLREVKEETYNKKVMCILHFFNYLKVKGHIERIPFDPDYYIKKTFQQHHDRSVEQEVMDEIMANLYKFSEDTRLMFLHLWGIGLRLSEVCTLKGNAYYMQGHDAWIQVYQIKMRTYKRIPIPMALYKLMKVYIAKYNRKADEYIFQNQKGGAYHKGTFKNKMIKACKECNVQNGEYIFRSHDYRHTIATAFYDTGVPIQSIRDYLGHDYEEMTRQYVDFMPKKIEKANEEYFKKGSLASCLRKGVNDNGE